MSIAADTHKALRSFRSLIGFAMRRVFFIKDLKDLDMGLTRFSIDIKDLKDLRRHIDDRQRGCLSPALRAHRDREVSPTGTSLIPLCFFDFVLTTLSTLWYPIFKRF